MSDDDIGGSGYGFDTLSAYLDRGRTPAIAAIDDNAECQALLASMERLGGLSRDLVARDARTASAEPAVLAAILSAIGREVRAGRDVPFPDADAASRLTITEGAIRELVRAAGDAVDGVLVGSVALVGEVTAPGAEVGVALTIGVALDRPLRATADAVRVAVHRALLAQTPLAVATIDVTVDDVIVPSGAPDASPARDGEEDR